MVHMQLPDRVGMPARGMRGDSQKRGMRMWQSPCRCEPKMSGCRSCWSTCMRPQVSQLPSHMMLRYISMCLPCCALMDRIHHVCILLMTSVSPASKNEANTVLTFMLSSSPIYLLRAPSGVSYGSTCSCAQLAHKVCTIHTTSLQQWNLCYHATLSGQQCSKAGLVHCCIARLADEALYLAAWELPFACACSGRLQQGALNCKGGPQGTVWGGFWQVRRPVPLQIH